MESVIHQYKVDNDTCTDLWELMVSCIVIRDGTPDPHQITNPDFAKIVKDFPMRSPPGSLGNSGDRCLQ